MLLFRLCSISNLKMTSPLVAGCYHQPSRGDSSKAADRVGGGGDEGNQLKPEDSIAAGTPNTTSVSGASTPSTPAIPPGKSDPSFKAQFEAFSKSEDTKSDGRQFTLSQSDKWMKRYRWVENNDH
jgi:hypothetical protein